MAINEDIIMNNTTTWTKTVYFTYDLFLKIIKVVAREGCRGGGGLLDYVDVQMYRYKSYHLPWSSYIFL